MLPISPEQYSINYLTTLNWETVCILHFTHLVKTKCKVSTLKWFPVFKIFSNKGSWKGNNALVKYETTLNLFSHDHDLFTMK